MGKNRKLFVIAIFVFVVFFISEAFIYSRRQNQKLTINVNHNDVYKVYAYDIKNNKEYDLGSYWTNDKTITVPISQFEKTRLQIRNYVIRLESKEKIGFIIFSYVKEDLFQNFHGIDEAEYMKEINIDLVDKESEQLFNMQTYETEHEVILSRDNDSTLDQGVYLLPGYNQDGKEIGHYYVLDKSDQNSRLDGKTEIIAYREIGFSNGIDHYELLVPYEHKVETSDEVLKNKDIISSGTINFNKHKLTLDVMYYRIKNKAA